MRCASLLLSLLLALPAHAADLVPSALALANDQRRAAGLRPLAPDPALARAAAFQADAMARAGRAKHGVAGGLGPRLRAVGLRGCSAAENVAMGQRGAGQVTRDWMRSAGHRRNVLNPAMTRGAVALARDRRGRPFWAMILVGTCR